MPITQASTFGNLAVLTYKCQPHKTQNVVWVVLPVLAELADEVVAEFCFELFVPLGPTCTTEISVKHIVKKVQHWWHT